MSKAHSTEFKEKVVNEYLSSKVSSVRLAKKYRVDSSTICGWIRDLGFLPRGSALPLEEKIRTCPECGSTFSWPDKEGNYKKYCSRECASVSKFKVRISSEVLQELYVHRKLSTDIIAKEYQCYPQTVVLLLNKYKIPVRTKEERGILSRKYQVEKVNCAVCKKTENLLIHHRDGEHSNNEFSNLVVLCSSCHCRLHHQLKKDKFTKGFTDNERAHQLFMEYRNGQSSYILHGYDQRTFNEFISSMRNALITGEYKYGNTGVVGDNMFDMMVEELRDVIGYSYLLYLKIEKVREQFLKYGDLKELVGSESLNAFATKKSKGID